MPIAILLLPLCPIIVFVRSAISRSRSRKQRALQSSSAELIGVPEKLAWPIPGLAFFTAALAALCWHNAAGNSGDQWHSIAYVFVGVYVLVRVVFLYFSMMKRQSDRRLGSTLLLNPAQPYIGGDLGGVVTLSPAGFNAAADSAMYIDVSLTCTYLVHRTIYSTRSRTLSTEWQEAVRLPLKKNASGYEVELHFNIPITCMKSECWAGFTLNKSVRWHINVESDFSSCGFGKIVRSWEVLVDAEAADEHTTAASAIAIAANHGA